MLCSSQMRSDSRSLVNLIAGIMFYCYGCFLYCDRDGIIMAYNLGIDIGIASVGFAGVNIDKNKILFSGVHIFEAAENPKDGSSLAVPRREKRGQRRI